MDSYKRQYFEQVQRWNENLDFVLDKEFEYKKALIIKFQNELTELKNQLKLYFYTNGYKIVEKHSFIEAKIDNRLQLVRIEFPEIYPDINYLFKLSIVEDSRREFLIYLIPDIGKIYIPRISNIRLMPKDKGQLNHSIIDLEHEFIFLENKIKEINRVAFHYCFHSGQIKQNSIEDLKKFDDFLTILSDLLSN